MKIYNYLGVELLDTEVDDKSYRYKELMSDNQLFLYFSLPYFIELPVGAYVDFKAERYFLSDPLNFKMNHTRDWEYTVMLNSYISLTKSTKFKFFTLVGGVIEGDFELKFSLTETAAEFAALFVQNMNQADPDGGWQVGDCIETEPVIIDFNHTYCYDVLSELADKFKTEWEIDGKTLHIRKVEKLPDSPISLTYGYDSGLIPGFDRSNAGVKKTNRLYIETSERNIDSDTYGRKTLSMLKYATVVHNGITYVTDASGSYIERQNRIGIILENSADLTHIYPKRVGIVSSVIMVNDDSGFYDFTDEDIEESLNYNDYLIAGETMTVIFQTGELAGLEFDVQYVHADRKFKLVPISENGIIYPKGSLIPAVGDKYAVFHCALPADYIEIAETEATNEAAAELYELELDKYTYNGVLDELYAKRHWLEIGGFLNIGYFVSLTLENAITDPVNIRIVAVKDYINKPMKPEITLSNEASGRQLGSALAQVKNKEQAVKRLNNDTTRFAKRGFRDAQETAKMIQDSLLNFTGSISPITVQTMQLLVGDESLQFEFVANSSSTASVPHAETYNPSTKQFSSAAGILQHRSLGITSLSSSHTASEYKWWSMAEYISAVLDEADKSYYLYAKCSKTENTGVFLLSETAIAIEQMAGYYHLLVGILNAERDSDRSYSPLYGYSELTPGRLTIKKIVSPSGNVYFDLDTGNGDGEIGGNIKFRSTSGSLKDVQTALTETQTAAAEDATSKVNAVQVGVGNLLTGTRNFSGWEMANGAYLAEYYGNLQSVYAPGSWAYARRLYNLKAGKTYTFSAFVKTNQATSFYPIVGVLGTGQFTSIELNETGVWKRLKITFTIDGVQHTAGDALLRWESPSANGYWVAGIKLVEGNKDSNEWEAAYEDIQSQIAETNGYLTAIQADLQAQIDGQVISWFQEYDPFTTNYPASLWTTDEEKNRHANDTFTNTLTGWSWRWAMVSGNWGWVWISDTATSKALALAATAQDTADSKRRVFTSTPVPPYEVGDLWAQGATGDFLKCDVERLTGSYNSSDWSKSSKYTDDTAVNNLKIGNRNYVLKSLATQATLFLDGGTAEVVTDENYGNVVEYSRPAGSGNFIFQYALSPDVSKFKNTTVTFFVIAKKISETGSFFFGGWMNTFTKIHYDSSWIEGVNGWRQYYATFTTDENGIVSVPGNAFGINSIQGTWRFYAVGVVLGNKPVDWTAAPEDTEELISTAQTTANTATANIADMFNSNKATPADKVELKRRLTEIEKEYERIYEQCDAIANEQVDYFYDIATDLVAALTSVTSNMSTTTDITSLLLENQFDEYYELRDIMLGKIAAATNLKAVEAKAEADAQAYLKDAIAQTTEINGGLVLAAALCARDAEGNVRAYLNGLQSKPYAVGAGVTGWGTGAEAAKSWIDFLGNAKFGNLRIGINGDGTCWIEDTAGVTRLEFSSKAIPALATLLAASGQDTTVSIPASSHNASTLFQSSSLVVNNDGSEVTIAGSVTATAALGTGNVAIGVYCYLQNIITDETYYYVGGVNIYLSNNINEPQTLNPQTLQLGVKLTNVPAGTYKLCISSDITTTGTSTASVAIAAGSIKAYYTADNRAMLLGSDGMSLIWNLNQYFHMKAGAVAYRGAWDVPAGLGGASINSAGSVSAVWGKINASDKVVKSGNNYTITHNIGNTDYSLILTPISTSVPYFSSKSANTIVVTCAGGFDFVLVRTK